MKKAIIITGVTMPDKDGFIDMRVYGDGKVVVPCGGRSVKAKAKEIELPEEDGKA